MIALLQRVSSASVTVDGEKIAAIPQGLLVLLAVEKKDDEATVDRLAEKILKYRVFADADDKMNLSVLDIKGSVLMVPQFTLAADTRKGRRPGFSSAASPAMAEKMFRYLVQQAHNQFTDVESGEFGADMQVQLINDGPVTFWLQTKNGRAT